jgi:DNA-binding MarR family transcriptional regulator
MNTKTRPQNEPRPRRGRAQSAPTDSGCFAYQGLDRALHEQARLGIMLSLLSKREGRLFSDLKRLCDLTDGNLSRHLEVLQQAGFVHVWKGFENRRPQTLCRLSADGNRRFQAYLAELQHVVRDAAPHISKRWRQLDPPRGWDLQSPRRSR